MPTKTVEDTERKKGAIHNALRVACLSIHGKSLQAAATHYQDLMSVPHHVTDPHVYYDALESSRIRHNGVQGIGATQHRPHQKSLEDFYRYYQAHHPNLSPHQVREMADREAHIFQYEIEDKLQREKPDKPFDEQEVFKILDRKLKNFMKPHKESAEPKSFDNPNAYHGFHATSAFGMANASRHLDDLLKWAKEDVAKGGKGHHFREQILNKGIKHIGPRECGLAWYLLSPNRSELSYIDNTILDALGYKPKDITQRDQILYERQLMAGRDASGYAHIPLGQFQKGLMDQYHGPVSYETLAVHDPVRVRHVNWQPQAAPHVWPEWWNDTKPYRDDVAKDWNENIGKYNAPQTVMAHIICDSIYPDRQTLYVKVGDRYLSHDIFDHNDNFGGAKINIDLSPQLIEITSDQLPIRKEMSYYAKSNSWIQEIFANYAPHYTTRILPYKLATVGPQVDMSIVDPLANQSTDAMPSWSFLTEDDGPCEKCHGAQVIEMGGKIVACPLCRDWSERRMFDEQTTDPTINPEPGVLDPSPSLSSP